MATKHFLVDPEYDNIPEQLREKRMKIIEEKRSQAVAKIESILRSQFLPEIMNKEAEVDKSDDFLNDCRCKLDRLRACIITKYYATASGSTSSGSSSSVTTPQNQFSFGMQKTQQCTSQNYTDKDYSEMSIHPAVRECLGNSSNSTSFPETVVKTEEFEKGRSSLLSCPKEPEPPQSAVKPSQEKETSRFQAPYSRTKVKIVFGNISKYIPASKRMNNDQLTHVWKAYVREDKGHPKISEYVKKVRFILHPSFRPNDVIEVSEPPFELTRRGWGDFTLRIQLHFQDPRNKPVDFVHYLKLDKTYTGLATLGPEVHAELQLYHTFSKSRIQNSVSCSEETPGVRSINNQNSLGPCTPSTSLRNEDNVQSPSASNTENIAGQRNEGIIERLQPLRQPDTAIVSTESFLQSPYLLPSPTCHESPHQGRQEQISKALIIDTPPNVNVNNTNNFPKNGVTAFVKCTDSQGRTLLVPQSSLIRISSNNANEPSNAMPPTHIPNSALSLPVRTSLSPGLPFIQMKQPPSKLSNPNLPLYILRPMQPNGTNQLLLVSSAEKKKATELSLSKGLGPCLTSINGLSVTESLNKPLTGNISSFDHKRHMHWEEAIIGVSTDGCRNMDHLLKRVLKVLFYTQINAGGLTLPFCLLQDKTRFYYSGKRRAAEWQFSGIVRNALYTILQHKPNSFLNPSSIWSRKQIMLWCRKHGYVAERTRMAAHKSWPSHVIEAGSLCEPDDLIHQLRNENCSLSPAPEEEVDVCHIEHAEKHSVETHVLSVPHISPSAIFVKECASEIAVNIKPIEMIPGVTIPAIEEMLLSACREFAADIIRSAVNAGYTRMGGKTCPTEVTVLDVCLAIRGNEDLEFLGNKHLGVPFAQLDS